MPTGTKTICKQKLKRKSPTFFLLVFLFGLTQLAFFCNEIGFVSIVEKKLLIRPASNLLSGDIFFTGNLRGVINECIDCQGNKGLLPKISNLIRSYEDSISIDLGAFTSYNGNNIVAAFYNNFFDRIRVSAINLTKRDFENILKHEELKSLPYVSSNIKEEGIDYIKSKKIELIVKNRNESKKVQLNIVCLTDDSKYYKTNRHVEVENQLISLNKIGYPLKGKVILLYYDSEFNLRKLLERYKGPLISFVIGCYRNSRTNKVKSISGIPYAYIGGGSNNIGHLKVLIYRGKTLFKFDWIDINSFYCDDFYITNQMEFARKRIQESR